jgi:ParB family chromosome partitioning protein
MARSGSVKASFVELPVASLTSDQGLRQGEVDMEGLADSVAEFGVLEPLVLSDERTVVLGTGRLAAARRAGLETVPCIIRPDLADPTRRLLARATENVHRVPLPAHEAAEAMAQLEPVLKAAAAKRKKATEFKGRGVDGRPKRFGGVNLTPPKVKAPTVRKQLAAATGMSEGSVRKLRLIRQAAKEDPAAFGHLPDYIAGSSLDAAYNELQRLMKHKQGGEGALASPPDAPEPPRAPDPPPAPLLPDGPPGDDGRAAAVEGKVRGLCFDLATMRARVEKLVAGWAASLTDGQLDRLRAEAAAILDALGGRDPEPPVEADGDGAPAV